jgi:hypothetical protein
VAQQRPRRNASSLVALLVVALSYGLLLTVQPQLTGVALFDGTLGVALGLYICSHPASAAVDLLYLDRMLLQRLTSEWSDLGWLALNLVVLVAG